MRTTSPSGSIKNISPFSHPSHHFARQDLKKNPTVTMNTTLQVSSLHVSRSPGSENT